MWETVVRNAWDSDGDYVTDYTYHLPMLFDKRGIKGIF